MYHNRDDVLHAEWSHSFHLLVGVIDDHEVRFERYKSLHGFKVFLLVSSFPNRTNKTRSIIRSTVLVTRFMSTFPKKKYKSYTGEKLLVNTLQWLCVSELEIGRSGPPHWTSSVILRSFRGIESAPSSLCCRTFMPRTDDLSPVV